MRRQVHALTPGDHFSPGTGSAIASVVHGLSSASPQRPAVLVAAGTYADRYQSADVIEYPLEQSPHGAPRWVRGADAALGRAGIPRPWARRVWKQTVVGQDGWGPSWVIGHNAPQLVPLVQEPHVPVLYAHNDVLAHYSPREAGRVLGSVHRVIAVSEFLADRLADRLPAAVRDRLRVVHNGVDVDHFTVPRSARGDRLRVGFVGRIIPDKGAHVLLEAAARTGRDDIAVSVVGSAGFSAAGPLTGYEQGLRRLAAGVRGPVDFLPFQPREVLPNVLAGFDVVVVPSVWPEPFALVVLEAMAAGAAVVASNIGGIPEAAGGAAILVQSGDVDGLAEALVDLQESPALLDATAAAGRAQARGATWADAAAGVRGALC